MQKEKLIIDVSEAIKRYQDFLQEKNNKIYDDPYYLDLLELIFTSFLFILNKDSIRLEGEHEDNYLAHYITEQIISFLAIKENEKYYINEHEFDSINDIIKLIRDKIAHGAFTINEEANELIIETDTTPITINKKAFIYFVVQLIMRKDLYSFSENYYRFHIQYDQFTLEHITTQQDIEKFLTTLQICELRFTSKTQKRLSPQQKDRIEKVLHNIKYSNVEALTNVDENLLNGVLQIYGIKSSIEKRPIKDSKFYTIVKEMIIDNLEEFITYTPFEQSCIVANWIHKSPEYLQREVISQGIFYNIDLIEEIKKSDKTPYIELLNKKNKSTISSSHNERLLATSLINFYILYQYPLEDTFKRKDNASDESYFDYGKLNLSSLNPTIFQIPQNRLNDITGQINATNKRVESIQEEIERLKEQSANITNLLSVETDGSKILKYNMILDNLSKNIDSLIEKIELFLEKQTALTLSYQELSNSPYYNNRYLIEYIRNAISHGKVYYRFKEMSLEEGQQTMLFINRNDKGDMGLKLSTTLTDFNKIFSDFNTNLLVEHMTSNHSTGRKID